MASMTYYAVLADSLKAPGVYKKIQSTVTAANNIGVDAEARIFSTSICGAIDLARALAKDKVDLIYIRYYDKLFFIIFPLLFFKRILGTKIIIDVPTPIVTTLKEMQISGLGWAHRVVKTGLVYLAGSLPLLSANRIVQYATEGAWFSLGLKGKTVLIGNSIEMDGLCPTFGVQNDDELNLIAVAQVAEWHGFDRLIRALGRIRSMACAPTIKMKIVGDGDALPDLKSLASDLGVEDLIEFTGVLTGKDLDNAFANMDIGVSSLGLYRIGLKEASPLKTREYMGRGLCVIAAGADPDFDRNSKFRFEVSNSNEIDSVINLLLSISSGNLPAKDDVYNFAAKNLTYEKKMKKIFSGVM